MTLQFKNKHIYFAVESVWPQLDYRFKYHLHQLVAANSNDDYVQEVTIDVESLMQIYKSVTSQPEGIAAEINKELSDILGQQLQIKSNIEAVKRGDETELNEEGQALVEIYKQRADAEATMYRKIVSGKSQILD